MLLVNDTELWPSDFMQLNLYNFTVRIIQSILYVQGETQKF